MKLNLAAARVNQRLTQAQAGAKIGVSDDVISNWERGISYPNAAQIKRIEVVYKLSFNDIIFLPEQSV